MTKSLGPNNYLIKRLSSKHLEELPKLNQLLNLAYIESNKITPSYISAEDLSLGELIILGFYKEEKLIGAVTIIPLADKTKIKVSRLFIKKEERSFKLLRLIFQEIHYYLRLNGSETIVINSEARLINLYEKLDFKKTGNYFYKESGSKRYRLDEMIASHKKFGIYGLFNGPIKWCLFMRPVMNRHFKRFVLSSPQELLIYLVYSPFAPITEYVYLPMAKIMNDFRKIEFNIMKTIKNHIKGINHVS